MAYFQGKVAFRQLIFGGYLVAITRILGYKKSDFKENEKHSEVRWISREEVDTFKEDTVKDFKNTLKLAFAKMEEMYGNTDE